MQCGFPLLSLLAFVESGVKGADNDAGQAEVEIETTWQGSGIEGPEDTESRREGKQCSPKNGNEPATANQTFLMPLFLGQIGPCILQRKRFAYQNREPDNANQKTICDNPHVLSQPDPAEAVE